MLHCTITDLHQQYRELSKQLKCTSVDILVLVLLFPCRCAAELPKLLAELALGRSLTLSDS